MTVELVMYVLGFGVGLSSAHTIFRGRVLPALLVGATLMTAALVAYSMAGMPRHAL